MKTFQRSKFMEGGGRSPGNQRKDGVALKRQNNFSTYQRDGVRKRLFIETEQFQMYTYYQTNIFKLCKEEELIQTQVGR